MRRILPVLLLAAGVLLVVFGLFVSPLPWLAPVFGGAALIAAGLFADVPEVAP